ncbi:MAG TPA: copper resistance protein CopC [bacterium]|nr:copper resistance protein CopC [bacterium]
MRRLTVFALATAGVLAATATVSAHALLRQSDPANGAEVTRAPDAVTMSFTEQPEVSLSIVHVLDSSGKPVERGRVRAVPGHPDMLTIPLGPLPEGVYTVSWRTVSAVDGHVTGGAFAFGVGQTPTQAPSSQPASPPPSVGYVVSRWLFYLGLSGLAGAAWVWTLAFREPPAQIRFLWVSWMSCAAGVIVLGWAQAADAGVSMARLLSTGLGQALWWRAGPIALAGCAVAAASRRAPSLRRLPLGVVGVATAATMLAHVLAGHAAASPGSWWWPDVLAQWLHFASVGAWIGGLAALLVALPGVAGDDAVRAARRFSAVAGIALGAVVATGVFRAAYEIDSWQGVLGSLFGRLVDIKATMLLALAVLGALNRYRSLPALPRTPRSLMRIGTTEIVLGATVLALTGYLTGLAPPRYAPAASATSPALVAIGHDFGTSVRLRLEVAPGTAGLNHFAARVTDYDTQRPVNVAAVTLTFTKPDRPDIGPSTLDLRRRPDGTYQADGANLSLQGAWDISALIGQGVRSVTVPLTVTPRVPPETIRTIAAPGQPTLYNIDLPGGGTLGTYLDPGKPGLNEIHATYTNAQGAEISIPRLITVTVAPPGGAARTLSVRRFSAGHFVADAKLTAGTWDLEFTATPAGGGTLDTHLQVRLAP